MVNFGLTAAFVINRAEQRHAIIAAAKKNKFFDTKMTDAEDEEDINKYPYQKRSDFMSSVLQSRPQTGAMCIATGFLVSLLGMMLFFERNLLRLGNLLIVVGVPLLLGPIRVKNFFMKKSRIQASIITAIGIFLVLSGRPRMGIICEIFGLLNLFGNMLPLLLTLAKKLPLIGDVLSTVLDLGGPAKPVFDFKSNLKFPQF